MSRRSRLEALKNINLLELRPIRAEPWEEDSGRIVIVRSRPTGRDRRKLGEWLRFWLSSGRIRLDELGGRVWLLLDGQRSVGEVADQLRKEFGDEVEPAEERAGEMVRRLHSEELVVYPGWDEIPREIEHKS
jgi:hypothetical protein